MKKVFVILSITIMTLSAVSCGTSKKNEEKNEDTTTTTTKSAEQAAQDDIFGENDYNGLPTAGGFGG